MLLRFAFKNFRSFRDEAVLDLRATKITERADTVVNLGHEKVLPVAAIYGANASGKSNVIDAFAYMQYYVTSSLEFGGQAEVKNKDKEYANPEPFLFDSVAKRGASEFEVYFTMPQDSKEKIYQYGFIVNAQGVVEEWLNSKAKTSRGDFKVIFYRNTAAAELDLSGISKIKQENIRVSLEKETLVVSLGAQLKIEKLKAVRDWFADNEILDFGRPELNFFLSNFIPEGFDSDAAVRQNVVKYLASFDTSIVDFRVETVENVDKNGGKNYKIDTVHRMVNGDSTATIPLRKESAGTLKMFAIYPHLRKVLNNGGILVVDELNSRLHPLLVRTLVLEFLNPELNKKHAQLIFTTFDSWSLNNETLRRDEIWFTDKDAQGLSTLYSLADIRGETSAKIRKDENYEKNYLLGKYGAIPAVKNFMIAESSNGAK
jgi:AAA15 family ATPase/GTPase